MLTKSGYGQGTYRRRIDPRQIQLMTQRMLQVVQKYTTAYKPTLDQYVRINQHNVDTQKTLKAATVILVPFMTHVLNKYTEEDWHKAMGGRYRDEQGRLCIGFDFIADWRSNHPLGYFAGLQLARMYRRSIQYDVEIASDLIYDILSSWGWRISMSERMGIRHSLYRIKKIF